MMAALPNMSGALCSAPQSLADADYYTVFRKKQPLLFSFITLVKLTNLHKNVSIYSWINTDYKSLKNSPSVCYIFFAIDDVIMMSVNTYTSMMGINIEDKYSMKIFAKE